MGVTPPFTIIVLCNRDDMQSLGMALRARSSSLAILHAPDLATLRVCLSKTGEHVRLLSFMSSVIVPADALARFDLGAYNIHPGSPAYPGTAPEAWAAYEQARSFGATAHAMSEKADAGPIIDQELLDVPAPSSRLVYAHIASRAAQALFTRLADKLVSPQPLAPDPTLAWGGTKRTATDFQQMCALEPGITQQEFIRRIFCFGPPDFAEFSITLHGHKFIMLTESGLKGYMDDTNDGSVRGWAWNMTQPTKRLELTIRVDERRDYQTRADLFRQDVMDAGHGDGYSGFCWTPPAELCDGLPHRVDALVAGRRLMGSPKLLVFRKKSEPENAV